MLGDGFHDVPKGKIAMIVTHLEMRSPVAVKNHGLVEGLSLRRVKHPPLEWYRDIFARVGNEWLWFSRLMCDDAELGTIIHDPDVHIFTLTKNGKDEALLELDFRETGECELAFFGLTPSLIGTGAGRALMDTAITQAWAQDINRFHVHTCTIDSPQALDFYRRSGFTPIRRQIEIADDPRLSNDFDRTLAAHVPILE